LRCAVGLFGGTMDDHDCVVSTNRSRPQLVHSNGPHCGILWGAAFPAPSVGRDRKRRGRCRRLRALASAPSRE
jgi:hypothetical protein